MKINQKLHAFLRHCSVVLFAFVAMGLIAMLALNLTFLNPLAQTMKDFSLTDVYYYVLQDHGQADTSRVVTIVDMTDLPDRAAIADVFEEIESMNPKVVGVDIVFEGLKSDTLADMHLMALAEKATNAVFSYYNTSDVYGMGEDEESTDVHSFFADEVPVTEGYTNIQRSLYGGVKRKVSLRDKSFGDNRTSLIYEVVQKYTDGALSSHEGDVIGVNFRPTVFRKISPDSIAYHRDWIENQIVFYGATRERTDMAYTPLGKMAGVELLAYGTQTLLEESEVRQFSSWATALISFFIVLITHLGRTGYIAWAKKRKSEWARYFLTTTFLIGFLLFLWSAFLVWCGFILFVLTNYSLNLGWALTAFPFLGGAGEFYGLTIRRYFGGFSLF